MMSTLSFRGVEWTFFLYEEEFLVTTKLINYISIAFFAFFLVEWLALFLMPILAFMGHSGEIF